MCTILSGQFVLTDDSTRFKSLNHLIALGAYDWVTPYLSEEFFPVSDMALGGSTVVLHSFNYHALSNSEAECALQKAGLKAATLRQLLSFGATYPAEQWKHPVVALGTEGKINGLRIVPFLGTHRYARILGILGWEDEWTNDTRYLIVQR